MSGHQLLQYKLKFILAGNLFLLSKHFLCLESFCVYRIYAIGPCYQRKVIICFPTKTYVINTFYLSRIKCFIHRAKV